MDEIRDALSTHGTRRAAAKAKVAQETAVIREWVPRAIEAGMPKTEIARLAHISRPALDAMLRDIKRP